MTREEYIKNLKNQGKVTVKDLAELLTFTLDKGNELMFEDDHVEVYIPINFDVDKVFGFDVCKTDNGDWVNLYLSWYPNKDTYDTKVKMYLSYCNNSTDDDDFELEVALTWDQHNTILQRLTEQYEKTYDSTIEKDWVEYLVDSEVDDYPNEDEEE